LLDLLEQAHGQPLQEGPAAAQALEERHGAEFAQALFLGPQRRLGQRQAAGVHEQQPHQGEGIADLSGALETAALAGEGLQIRRQHLTDHPPGLFQGERFHARKLLSKPGLRHP
jgi:hypothetical protein